MMLHKDISFFNWAAQSTFGDVAGNYAYMQSEINIKVGNKAPRQYFEIIRSQIASGKMLVSGIATEDQLFENLKINCVPAEIVEMEIDQYAEFLRLRRLLMAQKMKQFYFSL